jgi:hypothetical protein
MILAASAVRSASLHAGIAPLRGGNALPLRDRASLRATTAFLRVTTAVPREDAVVVGEIPAVPREDAVVVGEIPAVPREDAVVVGEIPAVPREDYSPSALSMIAGTCASAWSRSNSLSSCAGVSFAATSASAPSLSRNLPSPRHACIALRWTRTYAS